MARSGPINVPIQLIVKFFENGVLFDPFRVEPVKIFDVATGSPTPLAILQPDSYQTGIFSVTWDALSSSDSLQPGTYFDEWTWIAQAGMPEKIQRYSFELTGAVAVDDGDGEVTPTAPITIQVVCAPIPTWIFKIGLNRVEDVGNGTGVRLVWDEARPANLNNQVHYNIYFSDTRLGVFDGEPEAITTGQTAVINIPPGNINYFAVKATDFNPEDFDITELIQISPDVFQYPGEQTLLNDIDAYGVTLQVADTSEFASSGFLLVDIEIIQYVGKSATEFFVEDTGRGQGLTIAVPHSSGATIKMWRGVQDGNTIIDRGVASWDESLGTPRKVDEIGEFNVDTDGYRENKLDIVTTDLSASDANTADFSAYDFKGYHRPSLQDTFSGRCVGSYVGGDFGGFRGLDFQDRNLARLDTMLQLTGEAVILLRRKQTGRRCRCAGLRREHPRTRCAFCFGTGFDGGYDRFINTRAISEFTVNVQGKIMIRIYPYKDDVQLQPHQGFIQPSELTAWTLVFPTVKDRDILIRFNEDGVEEFRYECLDVTRNKLFFGESGKQEFRMRRLDKTDVVMQFNANI